MGSSESPPASAQRARTKASEFSDLFRSTHGSRHSSRTGAGSGSSPSSTPSPGGKVVVSKASSRRSMLPFLGRKKPDHSAAPPMPTSRKSVGNAAYAVTTVNTVRRSFGNGHAVLMITPPNFPPPVEPPLPKVPSVDPNTSSLGSKLVAHFTPLRSTNRNNKDTKVHSSTMQKPIPPSPPVPSPGALSPHTPEARAPSVESHHPSVRSRSTTPRPLQGAHSSTAENGDEEDFSDLFTLPDKPKRPPPLPKSASVTSVHIYHGDSPKSGEFTPTTPVTPLGPPLQFPIPPSTIHPPRPILVEKPPPRYSSELSSLSSRRSASPSKRPPPLVVEYDSTRSLYSDLSSQDERQSIHYRTTSISGSDTDHSRANDSVPGFKLAPVFPKHSSMKPKRPGSSGTARASSGPPPSGPLPSPPLSPNSAPRSAPIPSPNRVVFPRPRANTLSATSNLVVPSYAVPRSNRSSPSRPSRANSDVTPDGTIEELRDALSLQLRKNVQLQEYIVTITKRYEDERMAMTGTIEKHERTIRKKMREIEGLRWLVIHNGAVSDIDAAANLARSSLSTQDGDTSDGARAPSSFPLSAAAYSQQSGFFVHQTRSRQRAASVTVTPAISTPDIRSEASNSAISYSTTSLSESTSLTTPSLTVIPERIDGISRAQRQKLKEERRASKALLRISAVSAIGSGADPMAPSSSADNPPDPNFDPKRSMDEVFEKLQPFRHT